MTDHLAELQGKWRVIGLEVEGKTIPQEQIASSSITITGTRFMATGPGSLYEGEMTIDAAALPRRLSVAMEKGPELRTNHAIYEIKGDTLRICLNVNGEPAPRAFATRPGEPVALETLVRER